MFPAIVAHGMVAAHAERVQELARLYGLLERAVAASGADGEAPRAAHRALSARIHEWTAADEEAERRDVVKLAAGETEELLREIDNAILRAEGVADDLPPTDDIHDVIRSLQRVRTAFPTALPRAALVRCHGSAARLERLVALGAPAVIIANEPGLLLRAIERALDPIEPPQMPFSAHRGFQGTLSWAVHACVVYEPGASQGVNLGLGTSPAVAALLGVAGEAYQALFERWVESAAPSHPFSRYPFVPRGRFCRVSPAPLVRADLEETGPIGWAAGDDVSALARDLSALAGDQPAFAPELAAACHRIEAAFRRGHAVVGFIEYLSPEADGEMTWFSDPEEGDT